MKPLTPTASPKPPSRHPSGGADEILPTEIAQALLASAEMHYTRIPLLGGSSGIGEWLRRPIFVLAGAEGALQAAVVWIVLAVVAAVLNFGVEISTADVAEQLRQYFLTLTLLTGLFTLKHPSRLLHVDRATVKAVAENCRLLALATPDDLDPCDRILVASKKICSRRLTALWFGPASCWGAALFLFQRAFSTVRRRESGCNCRSGSAASCRRGGFLFPRCVDCVWDGFRSGGVAAEAAHVL